MSFTGNMDTNIDLLLVVVSKSTVSIVSYLKKKVMKNQSFINWMKEIPFEAKSASAFSGKSLWKDENIRLNYSYNPTSPEEIFINLQKNKASKLDGLKSFKMDNKLVTYAIKVGEALSDEEIAKRFLEPF